MRDGRVKVGRSAVVALKPGGMEPGVFVGIVVLVVVVVGADGCAGGVGRASVADVGRAAAVLMREARRRRGLRVRGMVRARRPMVGFPQVSRVGVRKV